MAAWQDDTLGAFGTAANVPTDTWFPVNTSTGAWDLPGQPGTLASSAGLPDVNAPPVWGGMPDQAPLSIGQVTGGVAPPMTTPRSLPQVQRLDALGALPQQHTGWAGILHGAVQGLARSTPEGRQAMQYADQQQQQQLQNRLVLRRQQLAEEQQGRQATQEGYRTLVAISQLKNKALRNMQFDRFAAQAAESGQALPADFIETYKKSSLAEGEGIAQAYGPLLEQAGFSPEQTARVLESGDLETIKGLLEGGLKVKKLALEQQEITGLDASRQQMFGTVGDVRGTAPTTAPTEPSLANVGMRTTDGGKEPLPIRMNNPLNIKQGPATQKWIDQGVGVPGDAATDGGRFIKFQTPQQGLVAAKDLLTGPTYSGLSVDAALKKWSNSGYGGEIVTGVEPTKKIADLTPGELTRTLGAMMQREGGGTSRSAVSRDLVAGPGAPSQEPARLAQLNQQIAAMDQFITANIGRGSERTRAAVTQVERLRDTLTKERDQLTEPSRAGVRTQAEARARTTVEREMRGETTLAEAFKGETPSLYDTQTGQTLDARMTVKDYEALPQGRAKMLSSATREQMEQLNQSVPIIAQLQTHIDKIYGPGGVLARMTPDDRALITSGTPVSQRFLDQLAQKYPELIQAQRFIDANAGALARSLAGEKGAMAEGDVERARAMLPNLITSLQVWPLSKIGVKLPDTRAVALGTMNSVVDMMNARGRTLLGNEQYTHPKLHRYETAEEAQQQTGTPGPTTTPTNPRDIAPEGKPAVGLNPNWRAPGTPPAATAGAPASGQRALKAMSPAQLRQLPDALARAVIANPGMEQGLSPEQKEALADGLERWERSLARR